ncbi:MAG: dihydroorotate dehydrogenase-like protein [Phycisphaerales bacterium]|nr:dihydroorotate dehydrogenase-like protein [Phycisphaerales bacterium]MCB9855717.1 dihydroorotate dehydrogenase-like protein [Phycisphaerales bacterium]MCB9862612.1 dihydroorotate dehydrogenase-like protein [Phycisphaerales bacterium]
MNFETNYMGMTLKNPLVPSASPMTSDLDGIRRLEDAGAAAIVLPSLFEEQIRHDAAELVHHLEQGTNSYGEAITYFPEPASDEFAIGPEAYLKHVDEAKRTTGVPIIASLNGSTMGGWTDYARNMEQAGADAIELNIYHVAADIDVPGEDVEKRYIEILSAVRSAVNIPVAVKLGPYFSSMANMAKKLDEAGADALVLFNRFYQPDIDLELIEVVPNVVLSNSHELRLPLRWIAILYGRIETSLAATTGVHSAQDAIKLTMAGADVIQMASTLLRRGSHALTDILDGMKQWMEENEYESLQQMKGSLSQKSCPDPTAFERANYMRALQRYM